jgi:hypothetical protein
MKAPPGSTDISAFKTLLRAKNARMEEILNQHISETKNTGFTDARLCQMAYSKFEEGWLLLEKALRIDHDGREYGKVPLDTPIPSDFAAPASLDDRRFGADADDGD